MSLIAPKSRRFRKKSLVDWRPTRRYILRRENPGKVTFVSCLYSISVKSYPTGDTSGWWQALLIHCGLHNQPSLLCGHRSSDRVKTLTLHWNLKKRLSENGCSMSVIARRAFIAARLEAGGSFLKAGSPAERRSFSEAEKGQKNSPEMADKWGVIAAQLNNWLSPST